MKKLLINRKILYILTILLCVIFSVIALNIAIFIFEEYKPSFLFEIIIGIILGNIIYFSNKNNL
jgi:uncharacterized membrane protein YbhN (UPF0104 family)